MNKNSALATCLCLALISLSIWDFKSIFLTISPTSEIEPYLTYDILSKGKSPFDDKFVLQSPNNFSDNRFDLTIPDNWPTGTIGIARVDDLPPPNVGAFEEYSLPDDKICVDVPSSFDAGTTEEIPLPYNYSTASGSAAQ